jgi:methionyl-tRNA synthetase
MDKTTITLSAWQYAGIFGLLFWSIVWKGLALWRAAKNNDKAWFIAILIINSVGLLEIFYIFVFAKRSQSSDLDHSK